MKRLGSPPPSCISARLSHRAYSTQSRPRTGIVMMNLGDHEIIKLPLQPILSRLIVAMRTPKVIKLYQSIGGGSPIGKWTNLQGQSMVKILDSISPATSPHKFYVAFRYARPLTEECLEAMRRDGVERAVAFTQYPQFSCATTGSSLNELWRQCRRLGLDRAFAWSVIDRWYDHPRFIETVQGRLVAAVERVPAAEREGAVVVFSAHSLPMQVVERGDPYPAEIAATVHEVMRGLRDHFRIPYLIAYQSRWLGPPTDRVLEQLGRRGVRAVVVVPIAFTSDHIETLREIDQDFAEVARRAGIRHFLRAESLNDDPVLCQALAEIVASHLAARELHSMQYSFRCPGCENPICRTLLNPATPPASA